eukprot:757084-Hanusia_phi.AAC.3
MTEEVLLLSHPARLLACEVSRIEVPSSFPTQVPHFSLPPPLNPYAGSAACSAIRTISTLFPPLLR